MVRSRVGIQTHEPSESREGQAAGRIGRRQLIRLALFAVVACAALAACQGTSLLAAVQADVREAEVARAIPVITPVSGTYSTDQRVVMTSSVAGAEIFYTTDGSNPTTSSTRYTKSFEVGGDGEETIKAVAYLGGSNTSPVSTAVVVIHYAPPSPPTITPGNGTYSTDQNVEITESTTGDATIYYTTNGDDPTTGSSVYTGPIQVAGDGTTKTIKAIAVSNGGTSVTASATITIDYDKVAAPYFSPSPGTYTTGQQVLIGDSTSNATIHYTTNGSTPSSSSPTYTAPINVSGDGNSVTIKAIATAPDMADSDVTVGTYVINYEGTPAPYFNLSPGTYSVDETVTIGDSTPGAAIYYTTDNSTPTTSSAQYNGGIQIAGDGMSMTIKTIAVASGRKASNVVVGTFNINYSTVSTPTISPPDGSSVLLSAHVTITDDTPGAQIYYTTNGSEPDQDSTPYPSGGFTITSIGNGVVRARAYSNEHKPSAVATATYTILGL